MAVAGKNSCMKKRSEGIQPPPNPLVALHEGGTLTGPPRSKFELAVAATRLDEPKPIAFAIPRSKLAQATVVKSVVYSNHTLGSTTSQDAARSYEFTSEVVHQRGPRCTATLNATGVLLCASHTPLWAPVCSVASLSRLPARVSSCLCRGTVRVYKEEAWLGLHAAPGNPCQWHPANRTRCSESCLSECRHAAIPIPYPATGTLMHVPGLSLSRSLSLPTHFSRTA